MMKVAKNVFLLTLCMSDVATDRSSSARETCTEDDLLREEKVVSAEQESGQHVKSPGLDSTFASSGTFPLASTMADPSALHLASSLADSLPGGVAPKTTLETSAFGASTLSPAMVASPFGETPSRLLEGTLSPASTLRASSSNRSGGVETFEAWLTRHGLDSVEYMMDNLDNYPLWPKDPTFRMKKEKKDEKEDSFSFPFQPYDVRFVPDEAWNKPPQYVDPPQTSKGLNLYQTWRLFPTITQQEWAQWKPDTKLARIRKGFMYPAKKISFDRRFEELIDICFVMDATSSMRPWIEATMETVKEEVGRIASSYGKTPRIGIVAYRDVADTSEWLPKQKVSEQQTLLKPEPQTRYPRAYQFTRNKDQAMQDLKAQQAYGGTDIPEDVVGGLNEALHLDWKAPERILLLITDAPPHGYLAQAAKILNSGDAKAKKVAEHIKKYYYDNFEEGDPSKIGMGNVLQKLKESLININLVLVGKDVEVAKEWAKIMQHKYMQGTSDGQQMGLHSGEFQVMHYKDKVNMSSALGGKLSFIGSSLEKTMNAMARTMQATDLGSTLGGSVSDVSPEIRKMREEADRLHTKRASDFDTRGSPSSGLAASGVGLYSTKPSTFGTTLEASGDPLSHPMASTLAASGGSPGRTPMASTLAASDVPSLHSTRSSLEASGVSLPHSAIPMASTLASSVGPPPHSARPMNMTLVGRHTTFADTIGA